MLLPMSLPKSWIHVPHFRRNGHLVVNCLPDTVNNGLSVPQDWLRLQANVVARLLDHDDDGAETKHDDGGSCTPLASPRRTTTTYTTKT